MSPSEKERWIWDAPNTAERLMRAEAAQDYKLTGRRMGEVWGTILPAQNSVVPQATAAGFATAANNREAAAIGRGSPRPQSPRAAAAANRPKAPTRYPIPGSAPRGVADAPSHVYSGFEYNREPWPGAPDSAQSAYDAAYRPFVSPAVREFETDSPDVPGVKMPTRKIGVTPIPVGPSAIPHVGLF
jgi:hypothetical protein